MSCTSVPWGCCPGGSIHLLGPCGRSVGTRSSSRRGRARKLVDVDGRSYVDWVMSWGPLIAGHAHPEVVAAVTEAAAGGMSFGAPTEAEVELAAEVVRRVPSADMVRMTSSGTEAAMSAVRLARAVTGRDPIVKFAGAYHGHADGLLADAGSGLATQGIPASPGVTAAQAGDTVVVPWNDRGAVDEALSRHVAGRDRLRALPREHGPGAARAGIPRLPARACRPRPPRCSSSTRSSRGSGSRPAAPRAARAFAPTCRCWARSSAAGCRRPHSRGGAN